MGEKQSLHGIGRLLCPEGLTHRSSSLCRGTCWDLRMKERTVAGRLSIGNTHLPIQAQTSLCWLLPLYLSFTRLSLYAH